MEKLTQSNVSQRRNVVAVYTEKRRNVGSVSGFSEKPQKTLFFSPLALPLRVKSERANIHTAYAVGSGK